MLHTPFNQRKKEQEPMENRKHFLLVHGICHGAWCWYKLASLLQAAGHSVTPINLAGCGPDPRTLDQIGSALDHLQPLMEVMGSLDDDEKVVLVGHSYGGLAIALAMERFCDKVSVGVFVSAYMPNFDQPPATQIQEFFKRTSPESLMDCNLAFDKGPENGPTSATFGPEFMATNVYQYCTSEDIELAKMLVRPGGLYLEHWAEESLLTRERYGSISRVYIVCKEDELMKEEFQEWVIESSPPNEVRSISGAGHMVMLSKPKELCLCLEEIADCF